MTDDEKEEPRMSSQIITPNTEAAILARIIQSDDRDLTPDAARYLLSMKLPSTDENRVDELSAKARDGSLTESERRELESYLHIGTLLGVMQSKARRLVKSESSESDPTRQ
jgi:hypothetical protein